MRPQSLWSTDSIFIEIGLRDAKLARCLKHEGYEQYLGVGGEKATIERLKTRHPEVAEQLVCSRRKKLVLNNNAQVLALEGKAGLYVWKYKAVRHAEWVIWRRGFNLFSLLTLLGCLCHMLAKHFSWPHRVSLAGPDGKKTIVWACRVLRQKVCRRNALHFFPHRFGLAGTFKKLDEHNVQYVVLRWFEDLPHLEPEEDVDMLIADDSLETAIALFASAPGIQPCDVYSETGLPRSDYCGTPYYPHHVARRLLEGAVRHNDVCWVPNDWDYFHSLAYHAVYHKGPRSDLDKGDTGVGTKRNRSHDYALVLGEMAERLGVDPEISLEGLHSYLVESGWGPSPEMLARLAIACWRNEWLQLLASRLERHVVDQGLAVFVVRKETVERGYADLVEQMICESGFDILSTKLLTDEEIEFAALRTRGGNWSQGGPFDRSGGPPALTVIAYDHQPQPLTRKQLKRFPERTNARIFVKEEIRDRINAEFPKGESFNALHSSDHAAEAWHLIEVLAPDLMESTREQLQAIYSESPTVPMLPARQAA